MFRRNSAKYVAFQLPQCPYSSSKLVLCGRYFLLIFFFDKTAFLTLEINILTKNITKNDSWMVFWWKYWKERKHRWYSKVIVKGGKGSPMAGPWPDYWQSFGKRQSPLLPPLDVSPPTVVLSPRLGHLSEAHLYKLIFFQHLLEQDKQDQGKVKEVNVRPLLTGNYEHDFGHTDRS